MHPSPTRHLVLPRVLVLAIGIAAVLLIPGIASAHTVQPGDTLSEFAARHGVSTAAVAAANGITNTNDVREGQRLLIPSSDGSSSGSSDGGSSSSSGSTHVVQRGETLSEIATRFGVTTRSLAASNGLSSVNRVRSGMTLRISGTSSSGTSSSGTSSSGTSPSGSSSSGSSSSSSGRSSSVRQHIANASSAHGWSPAIPLGLAMQESGWNNSMVSSAGARGIMQVLPSTGAWVGRVLLGRSLDLSDPADNAAAGVAYLDYLYNRFDGDIVETLAAYYEGMGNVSARGPSTGGRRYAANVLALADRYR